MAALSNQVGPHDTEAPSSRPEEGSDQGLGKGLGRHRVHPVRTAHIPQWAWRGWACSTGSQALHQEGLKLPSVYTDSGEQRTSPAELIAQKKIANILLPPFPPPLA